MSMKPDELCKKAIENGVLLSRYTQTTNREGYKVISLSFGGIKRQVKVHRFVWIERHGIPIGKKTVIDHINGKKDDNRLENLRLVDEKGNAENRRSYRGEGNPASKIKEETVREIRKEYRQRNKKKYHHGVSYDALAKKYKVSKSLIAQILRNEIWKS